MSAIIATTDTSTKDDTAAAAMALRADRRRRAYSLAALSGLHWETCEGGLEHGVRHIRKLAHRAAFLRACEILGIEVAA